MPSERSSAPESLARELRTIVRRAQAEKRVPALTAAVAHAGELVWTDAVGLADVETGREATIDDQFQVGSITKTFTAVAIMRLREAGVLGLDDPLGEHLPQYGARSATLRRLLSHASGLQRELPGSTWETWEFPTPGELLDQLGDVEHVLGPHEHFHYSNLAFALLGEVVSARSSPARRS